MAEFGTIHWSWESNKVDARRTAYMPVVGRGRITLAELTDMMRELAPDLPPEEIDLNWATVKWSRPATPEEYAQRVERDEEHRRRTEEWERKKLVELTDKYGSPNCGLGHDVTRISCEDAAKAIATR